MYVRVCVHTFVLVHEFACVVLMCVYEGVNTDIRLKAQVRVWYMLALYFYFYAHGLALATIPDGALWCPGIPAPQPCVGVRVELSIGTQLSSKVFRWGIL